MINSGTQALMRLTVSSVEQLTEYVGQDLGTSDWYAIRQHDVHALAGVTGDRQWISEENR